MPALRKEGGWVGIVTLLLVVLIVGFLASGTLRQYIRMPAMQRNAGSEALRDREAATSGRDLSSDPSPGDAMERVRRLQNTVRRSAEDIDEGIDRSAK